MGSDPLPVTMLDDARTEVISNALPKSAVGTPRLERIEPFEDFYRREMPRLVALARGLAGAATAEELAQEAMLAAYRRWATIARYERPEAWVRRVCANKATSVLRRRGNEAKALLRLAARPTAVVELEPCDEEFWFALRYLYGLSVAEIAAILDCSEGTVKVHLTRARAALVRSLGEDES